MILKENGNKKVKLHDDGYGLELFTMRNGYQWSGQSVDNDLLIMLKDVINEHFGVVEVITQQDLDNALEAQREACAKAAWKLLDPVNYPKFSQDFKQAILAARIEE